MCSSDLAPQEETRHRVAEGESGIAALALDSASLVKPEDAGAIVLTGSHGALLGGRPETAIKVAVFGAVYNDADRGIDDAGISRLPALDQRGIGSVKRRPRASASTRSTPPRW